MPFGKQERYMSRYPTLASAVAACNSGDTLIVDRASTVDSNVTIPATVNVRFEKSGLLTISNTYTLTINSLEAGDYQIFDCSACVTSGGVAPLKGIVNVAWFGAIGDGVTDDTDAFQTAIDTGLDVYVPYTGSAYQLGDLDLDNNYQALYSDNKQTELEYTGSATFLSITVNHVRIEKLTLTGPGSGSTYGVQIASSIQRNFVIDCIIQDFDIGYSDEGFDNLLREVTFLDYATTGAESLGGANWHVEHCRFAVTTPGAGMAHIKPAASDNDLIGCIFGNGYRGIDCTEDGTNMITCLTCHFEGPTEQEVYAAAQNSITLIGCRSSGLFRAGQSAPYGPRFTFINMRFRDTPVFTDSSQATWVFIGCENADGTMFTGGPGGGRIMLDQYGPMRAMATPELYGAAGDGSTDDRDAVWNTSNYLDDLGGGFLILPPGRTYRLASNCIFHDTVTVVAAGGMLEPDNGIYTRPRKVISNRQQFVDCSNCTTPGTDGLQLDWGESRVSWCGDIAFAAGALTAGGTLYVDEDATLGAALSIASDVLPVFINDAVITLGNYDLTLNGPVIAPSKDVFSYTGTGVVVFTGGSLLMQDGETVNSGAVSQFVLTRIDTHGDGVTVGRFRFTGKDSEGNDTNYAEFEGYCTQDNDTAERGRAVIKTNIDGTSQEILWVDDRGSRARYGGHIDKVQTVTGTSVTVDCEDGLIVRHDPLTGATTYNAPDNPSDGAVLKFRIQQDGSGGAYTVSFNSVFKLAGGSFTMSTGNDAIDTICFVYDSTDTAWYELSRAQNLS